MTADAAFKALWASKYAIVVLYGVRQANKIDKRGGVNE